jgi:hypothetical protein
METALEELSHFLVHYLAGWQDAMEAEEFEALLSEMSILIGDLIQDPEDEDTFEEEEEEEDEIEWDELPEDDQNDFDDEEDG